MKLSELKKQMRFNRELLSLIGTLKNIASSHYHSLEREKERFERFMEAFQGFFRVVHLTDADDPFVRGAVDRLGIVAVTSDFGFMGGLNAGVIEAVYRAQGARPDGQVQLIVMGEKGAARLADAGREFRFFKGIELHTRYEQALEMTDYLVGEVRERRLGQLQVVYPKPLSFTRQAIQTLRVLPYADLVEQEPAEVVQAPAPAGRLSAAASRARRPIVESSLADLVDYLSRTWISARLFEVFEDSKLAEFGARTMHLEESEQKLDLEQKKLQHRFFRASHEKIDKGMRESFSAGNVRKKRAEARE